MFFPITTKVFPVFLLPIPTQLCNIMQHNQALQREFWKYAYIKRVFCRLSNKKYSNDVIPRGGYAVFPSGQRAGRWPPAEPEKVMSCALYHRIKVLPS
jgi:hypothetical protein